MAKRRWFQSVDLSVDDDGLPLFEKCLEVMGGGFAAASNPGGAVTVGSTSTAVLAANADRRYAELFNDSDQTIYLSLGGDAALHSGPAIPAGSSYVIAAGNLYQGAVTAICADGGKVLTVVEA